MPAISCRDRAVNSVGTRPSPCRHPTGSRASQGRAPTPQASLLNVVGRQHRPTASRRNHSPFTSLQPPAKCLSALAVHALRQEQPPTHQHAGSASAVRRDGQAQSCRTPWRPLSRIGSSFPALTGQRMLRSSLAAAPGTYKGERWGCCFSLDPGARLTAAPSQPPRGICPTTPHPRLTSIFHLGSPLCPQVYSSPGQPSIASWQTISRG